MQGELHIPRPHNIDFCVNAHNAIRRGFRATCIVYILLFSRCLSKKPPCLEVPSIGGLVTIGTHAEIVRRPGYCHVETHFPSYAVYKNAPLDTVVIQSWLLNPHLPFMYSRNLAAFTQVLGLGADFHKNQPRGLT